MLTQGVLKKHEQSFWVEGEHFAVFPGIGVFKDQQKPSTLLDTISLKLRSNAKGRVILLLHLNKPVFYPASLAKKTAAFF